MKPEERSPANSEIIYRGGHHCVVCDGKRHICIPEDQGPWTQGRCDCAKLNLSREGAAGAEAQP